MDAKERKAKNRETRASVKKPVSRHSSRVKVYYVKPQRRVKKRKVEPELQARPMSLQAEFDMLKPDNIHPLDWHHLFTADKDVWPFIVEAAQEAIDAGELRPYERTVAA